MKYASLFGSTIKIAIVDDHRLFREGLKKVIDSVKTWEIVMEDENGEKLLQFLKNCSNENMPDVILLDIQMPVMDGLATAEILKQEYPGIKVLVVSMHTDQNMVVAMLKRGVNGYINKNADSEELTTAIQKVYNGQRYFSAYVVEAAMNYLSNIPDHASSALSPKEMSIIALIFQEKTSEEISEKLFLSKRTVEGFIARIMEKLQVTSRVGIVLAALRNNIVNLDGEAVP